MGGVKSYPKKLYIDLFTGKVAKASEHHRNLSVCKNNKQRFGFVGLGFTYKTLKVLDCLGYWHVIWSRGGIEKKFQKVYEDLKIETYFNRRYYLHNDKRIRNEDGTYSKIKEYV